MELEMARELEMAGEMEMARELEMEPTATAAAAEPPVPVGAGAEMTPADLVTFDLRTLARFESERVAVTVLSESGAARLVLFAFEAGQELKEHETSSQILVQVLRGTIAFTAAGRTERARAGTLLQLEAHVRHSIVARSRAVVLVTLTPSPTHHSLHREVFAQRTPLVTRTPEA